MRSVSIWLGVILALYLLPVRSSVAGPNLQHPDFTGTWALDERMSEDPAAKLRVVMEELRSGSRVGASGAGGGRAGGMGGRKDAGGGRGGSGGRGGGGNPVSRGSGVGVDPQAVMRRRLAVLVAGADRLSIVQAEPQVSITYSTDDTRVLYTDGRKVTTHDRRGEVKTKSKWKKDQRLVVGVKSDRAKVTEIYELEEGGERLFVTVKLKRRDGMPPITFHRTYNPAEPEAIATDVG